MQKLRILSPVYYVTVACIVAIAVAAAAIVHNTSQESHRVFSRLVLLGQLNSNLLQAITSAIDFMDRPEPHRAELAGMVRTELSEFRSAWLKFQRSDAAAENDVSDLFEGFYGIGGYVDRFVAVGHQLISEQPAATRYLAYEEFLRLGRNQIHKVIAAARHTAQNEYTLIAERTETQLHTALGAILVLLIIGLALSHRTLSAMHSARRAAESADRAKSEFLATMSHEIRTPMNGVIGIAELLARSELNDKQRMYVSTIIKSGEALTAIINDVLDLSKISAGKMQIRPRSFDLAAMVEDIATLLSPRALEKHIELAVRIQPDLPSQVVGDEGHIRQVLINLAGNAVKFTERGHVLLDVSGRVENRRASLTFTVEDTGIGIPAEKCQRLFEQFSQVHDRAAQPEQGTGLGLAISSKLVVLMGGKIGVSSEPGAGSRFWFSLELSVDGTSCEIFRAPEDVAGSSVLVIDDSPVNRTILVEQLRSWRFETYAVDGPEKGLRALRETAKAGAPFDLVVWEHRVPDMSGIDFVAAMRAEELIRDIPVLMLTSVAAAEGDARFHRADGCLAKPVRPSLLLNAVVTVLRGTPANETEPSLRVASPRSLSA